MNYTVMRALNRCSTTGLEHLVMEQTTANGSVIRLYKDHKGWHRIVLFKSEAHSVGCSGVIVQACGEVYYKETCPSMRSHGLTRQLQAMLTVWGVYWYPSPYQTKAGQACYKRM